MEQAIILPGQFGSRNSYESKTTKFVGQFFFQDNTSAMKLESNGLQSCGEKSRHIDIRFFFIKDVLKRENIELKHCPTERMIADFFTKPLQGGLFKQN